MLVSVMLEHGPEVQQRLVDLVNAAQAIGGAKQQIGTDIPYATYVVSGTRPHDIYPRDRQALFWEGARHPVGHVHHPGTKPNPFLQRALDNTTSEVEQFVMAQLEQVASGSGSNYAQIMVGAAKLVLKAAQAAAPVRTGALRQSLYYT
jgi:hypothetical protein